MKPHGDLMASLLQDCPLKQESYQHERMDTENVVWLL